MQMPDADNPEIYFGIKDKAKDLYENSPYAIVADFGVPGFYETSQKLRGYENIACDLMIDQEFVKALFDRLLELQKRFFKNYLGQVGKYVQVIGYADDLGMQDRPQMAPEIYRKIVKPYHTEIFKFIHEQADVKILLHSCGAIFPLIDDLIEAGVDILNPVQTRATGMDPVKLKETFGDRILFWGGIDEQYVLPHGTRDEVFAEVEKMIRIMGKNGGYILGPGHNIQVDTPMENIVAMFDAARKYRNYK
jgi:uroporphyrinogen decarboxylase